MLWLINFLTGSAMSSITTQLKEAYKMRLDAQTNEQKLEADKYIAQLQAQQQVLLAEQGRWYTAWIRPLIALPVVLYVWKLIVWDTMLQWGVTPNPGDFVNWIVLTVIGAYFLTSPFERK